MKKTMTALWAMLCALFTMLITTAAYAAPVVSIDLGGYLFAAGGVVEEGGSSTVRVYGGSPRYASIAWAEFVVLSSTDNFTTAPTWDALAGVVGYAAGDTNTSIVICPQDKTCGGYKVFYLIDAGSSSLYRCTGMSDYKTVTGCSLWTVADMTGYDPVGIGLDQTGDKLLVGGFKVADSRTQIYSIDIATSVATRLANCSDAAQATVPTGSVLGGYFYHAYNAQFYRYAWTGATCTGARQLINAARGWDDAINTAGTDYYGAVGPLTGTFYASRETGSFVISRKNASCGDSFISGAENCDNTGLWPLNNQTCTSIPGGFTGGNLACLSCAWDTTQCTSPAVCGNGTKEGSEECDGSDFGGATCATELGAGYTGNLSCSSCSIVTSACVAPPTCGDTTCNGTETCETCPGDCGACCGNGTINTGEDCDGSNLGGATCASELGAGYTGDLSCAACSFVTSACVPPVTCGNGTIDGNEQCDGANLNGKTCESEKGAGWTGSLTCDNCAVNTSACVFSWGIKNLSGACSLSGTGANQTISFTGGNCTGEYWPIGAVTGANLKWISLAGKAIAVGVAASGQPVTVNVPQGVSHEDIKDNGHKWVLDYGAGFEAGPEGTDWTAIEQVWPEVLFTCTNGLVYFKYNGNYIAFTVPGQQQGRLPAGWGVGINVLTGAVTQAPYELGGGGTGGAGGTGGSGGSDAGTGGTSTGGTAGEGGNAGTGGTSTGGTAGSGNDAGPGGEAGTAGSAAGAAGSTSVTPPGDGGDDGGCSTCTTGGHGSSNSALFMGILIGLGLMSRRRRY